LAELGIRTLEITAFLAQRARSPVEIAQAVEYGSADPDFGVRFEFDVAFRFEFVDRVKQSEDAGIDEILQFDIAGQPRGNAVSNVFDQRKGFGNQRISFRWGHITASTGST
jgi:hypothetical protein